MAAAAAANCKVNMNTHTHTHRHTAKQEKLRHQSRGQGKQQSPEKKKKQSRLKSRVGSINQEEAKETFSIFRQRAMKATAAAAEEASVVSEQGHRAVRGTGPAALPAKQPSLTGNRLPRKEKASQVSRQAEVTDHTGDCLHWHTDTDSERGRQRHRLWLTQSHKTAAEIVDANDNSQP